MRLVTRHSHFSKCGGHDRRVVQLEGHAPWNVQGRRQFPQDHVAQNLGAVIVILVRVLHETEAVHVADERLAASSAE